MDEESLRQFVKDLLLPKNRELTAHGEKSVDGSMALKSHG
jgi:hypothetical protein